MLEHDEVYIGHMLDMCRQVSQIITRTNRAEYDQDVVVQLALTHLVQMIGEAAQRVSDEFRSSHPEIPWREIIGMRHRIVHDYLNVDEDVVWEVVQGDVPGLMKQLSRLMPGETQ